jgi:transcription elongation factor Elf1
VSGSGAGGDEMIGPYSLDSIHCGECSQKLGIAIQAELCYTGKCLDERDRGVLLLNAINPTQYLLWAKRPLSGGFTSRRSSKQRWQPDKGRFVMGKAKTTKATLKTELTCRKCGASWKHTSGLIRAACPYCGQAKDTRIREPHSNISELKNWIKDNPEKNRERQRLTRERRKLQVFFKIAGSPVHACIRCGCDDIRLLEINHKNGGGKRNLEAGTMSRKFHKNILNGNRSTNDLELLCRPCNAVHYLELKYGPLPMKVVWNG